MLNEIISGQPPVTAANQRVPARADNLGAQIVQNLHGRYAETTNKGNRFWAASQAVATTTVGLATTYTGLCISNPINSTMKALIDIVSFMQSVIQSTQVEAYAIATGFNTATNVTHTAATTIQSSAIGSNFKSQLNADTQSTLPTAPLYNTFLGNTGTATADCTGLLAFDLNGGIELYPGAYLCFVTPAQASVAGLWFSCAWEEVPLAY